MQYVYISYQKLHKETPNAYIFRYLIEYSLIFCKFNSKKLILSTFV